MCHVFLLNFYMQASLVRCLIPFLIFYADFLWYWLLHNFIISAKMIISNSNFLLMLLFLFCYNLSTWKGWSSFFRLFCVGIVTNKELWLVNRFSNLIDLFNSVGFDTYAINARAPFIIVIRWLSNCLEDRYKYKSLNIIG